MRAVLRSPEKVSGRHREPQREARVVGRRRLGQGLHTIEAPTLGPVFTCKETPKSISLVYITKVLMKETSKEDHSEEVAVIGENI